MHQRRTAHSVSGPSSPCCSDDKKGYSVSTSTGIRRRRRTKAVSGSFFNQLFKKDGTLDDLVVLLIQIICASILVGCSITLFIKWFISDSAGGGSIFSWWPSGEGEGRGRRHFELVPLKPSDVYTIPDSLSHVGDKSDEYATLRKKFDSMDLPPAEQKYEFTPKSMAATGSSKNDHQVAYDIYNCPDEPPHGYPYHWTLLDILHDWPADDPTPPDEIHQGLCVFDYEHDYDKAVRYREAELPFVVRNDPAVMRTAARWNYPGYMEEMLGDVMHRAEYSSNNHFMYWNQPPKRGMRNGGDNRISPQGVGKQRRRGRNGQERPWQQHITPPEGWSEPTKMLRMTYDEWFSHANVTDDLLGPDQPHWYFRLIGCGETGPEGQCDVGSSEYLYDELPFFQPRPTLYVVDPKEQKGIHCRFGMKGVIAENHFDGSRNAIVVLGGQRRYILSHPDQCQHLALLPKGHPSARHSAIDWSDPDLEEYPEFMLAKGNEIVLQAGDVLYLPTNWFHYIISLGLNFQCNTRSGVTHEYIPPIKACGF